jgi:hypothetical protein
LPLRLEALTALNWAIEPDGAGALPSWPRMWREFETKWSNTMPSQCRPPWRVQGAPSAGAGFSRSSPWTASPSASPPTSAAAPATYGRIGEIDAVGVECLFDHGERSPMRHELHVARARFHLHAQLNFEVAEGPRPSQGSASSFVQNRMRGPSRPRLLSKQYRDAEEMNRRRSLPVHRFIKPFYSDPSRQLLAPRQ